MPTGGDTINTDDWVSGYKIHVFTSTGNSTFTANGTLSCDILIVAGGGGSSDMSGGGGAGGFQYLTSQTVAAGQYTVTVGAGGIGTLTDSEVNGGNGGNSSFGSLTASVGGGGAGYEGAAGSSGGSGGGGSYSPSGGSAGGAGTAGQGYAGGAGRDNDGATNYPGGGGGGASEVGVRPASKTSAAGNGGDGIQNNIDGQNYWYAGGGGGHGYQHQAGNGGKGGGGGGNRTFSTSGAAGLGDTLGRNDGGDGADTGTYADGTGHGGANTGGGAGGGTNHSPNNNNPHFGGADGGSGIVIVRYAV